jgi:hypothetical protein
MNHPIGPWARSGVKAGEAAAPMILDGLTLPYPVSSGGRITGLNLATSPFTAGALTFQVEKNGVVAGSYIKTPTSPNIIDFPTSILLAKNDKVRLLLSSSSDLAPAGVDVLAYAEAP